MGGAGVRGSRNVAVRKILSRRRPGRPGVYRTRGRGLHADGLKPVRKANERQATNWPTGIDGEEIAMSKTSDDKATVRAAKPQAAGLDRRRFFLMGGTAVVAAAARPDRTSFGCGQDDKYPYFDDCFLSSMGGARDFAVLGGAVRECVRTREIAEKMSPPSEPQLWIGGELRPMLPLFAFANPVRSD
eukprot:gene7293-9839_t